MLGQFALYLTLLAILQVKVPLYGCDCYAYGLLAAGHVDLVVESGLKVLYTFHITVAFD